MDIHRVPPCEFDFFYTSNFGSQKYEDRVIQNEGHQGTPSYRPVTPSKQELDSDDVNLF